MSTITLETLEQFVITCAILTREGVRFTANGALLMVTVTGH